jgi:ABC-2 type transport system permease protein
VFRSVYLKTLRDYRVAILGWGIGMGLVMVELIAAITSLATTPQARAELESLASQFAWNAEAVRADTPGGYATWKLGIFVFLICVWPLLAASRTLRGEEERSSLDLLLSVPRGRARVALEKIAAIWTALVLMGVIIAVMTYGTGVRFNADFSFGDALLFGLNLSLICAVIGGVALLISQFTQERGPAAGATGGLLMLFIVVDMAHRVIPNTDWISRLSPIYYYNLSKPLVPSYGTNVGGLGVQLALAAVLSAVAVWLFVHRDVGDVVPLPVRLRRSRPEGAPPAALPAGDWSVRSIYARSVAMAAMPTLWWTLGMAAGAAWMVALVKQMSDQIQKIASSSPFLQQLLDNLGGAGAAFNDSLLSTIFFLLPVLLMTFAVTQVGRWTADEDEGRLEMILSTPQSRPAVLLGRFAALATSTVIIGVVTLAAVVVVAAAAGVTLDQGKLAAATLGIIPMGLFVAALGYLAGGWLRGAADTGLLSFLLAAWFFITFVGPELKWPESTLRLSALYYYGTPLLHGVQVGDMLVVVGVGAAALILATYRFARRDIRA